MTSHTAPWILLGAAALGLTACGGSRQAAAPAPASPQIVLITPPPNIVINNGPAPGAAPAAYYASPYATRWPGY
jgi:hypothetical protein